MEPVPEQTEAFRANVRRYCRTLGKTFGQLANDADLSREWLSKMLSGKANPTLPVCEKIARALGLPLELLVAVPAPKTTTSSSSGEVAPQNLTGLDTP
jgi:DNA-binding phage protein